MERGGQVQTFIGFRGKNFPGCFLRGIRAVIPKKLRSKLLAQLHVNHPGMSKVKAVARVYFWWPGLDGDIERIAKKCLECQSVKRAPPVSTLHPWVWPTRPWQRLCGGLFKALCFICWWMPTQSGQRCSSWQALLPVELSHY